jgi:hypothetical protein
LPSSSKNALFLRLFEIVPASLHACLISDYTLHMHARMLAQQIEIVHDFVRECMHYAYINYKCMSTHSRSKKRVVQTDRMFEHQQQQGRQPQQERQQHMVFLKFDENTF